MTTEREQRCEALLVKAQSYVYAQTGDPIGRVWDAEELQKEIDDYFRDNYAKEGE
jgi:hypothetical protein